MTQLDGDIVFSIVYLVTMEIGVETRVGILVEVGLWPSVDVVINTIMQRGSILYSIPMQLLNNQGNKRCSLIPVDFQFELHPWRNFRYLWIP